MSEHQSLRRRRERERSGSREGTRLQGLNDLGLLELTKPDLGKGVGGVGWGEPGGIS